MRPASLEVHAWPRGRLPGGQRARLRRRDPPAGRRRAPQPAARPAADRGAHPQLRDQRRARARDRGDGCGSRSRRTANGGDPETPAEAVDETRISLPAGELLGADPLAGDLDVRHPRRLLGRRALRRGPAQRRDLRQRPSELPGRHRAHRGHRGATGSFEVRVGPLEPGGGASACSTGCGSRASTPRWRASPTRSGSTPSDDGELLAIRIGEPALISALELVVDGGGLAQLARAPGAGCARRASASSRPARRSSTASGPRRSAAAGPRARSRRGRRRRRRS